MVFCYKIITESPGRSVKLSPRRSPARMPQVPSSVSQLLCSLDYETCQYDQVLDEVPEREWRLLAAMARKREENEEREKLAAQFRKMWLKEKEERKMAEEETLDQYKRYLHKKREQEQACLAYKRLQRITEQQMRRGQIMDCIQHKQQRSEDLRAWHYDKKTCDMLDKALEDQARAIVVADRRYRLGEAEEWRRRLELAAMERKVDEARRRRNTMLKEASQRVAISNALTTWETCLLRQEITAMEAAKRAHHAARVALADARSTRLARARDIRVRRAREMAAFTAQLRDALRDRVINT